MLKFGKWIGAGLGWSFGGPIGALLGFAVGSFVDAANYKQPESGRYHTTSGDFMISLLVVMAAVMKADQKVMKSELAFVRNYLTRSFGNQAAGEMLIVLRDLLKKDIPVRDVAIQIRSRMDYPSRLQLMHLAYGIAQSDGIISEQELRQLQHIAELLGIKQADSVSLKGMYIKSTDWAYKILGIEQNAGFDEIKKAYRRMAMKNHPDKVAYLGEDVRMKAKEKFQKVKEAYEVILKEKGYRN